MKFYSIYWNFLFKVGISHKKVGKSKIDIKNSNTCIHVNISGFVLKQSVPCTLPQDWHKMKFWLPNSLASFFAYFISFLKKFSCYVINEIISLICPENCWIVLEIVTVHCPLGNSIISQEIVLLPSRNGYITLACNNSAYQFWVRNKYVRIASSIQRNLLCLIWKTIYLLKAPINI